MSLAAKEDSKQGSRVCVPEMDADHLAVKRGGGAAYQRFKGAGCSVGNPIGSNPVGKMLKKNIYTFKNKDADHL